ncbi:MAG: Unknown protein [uncultured Sulfurovum sp.]|uniref:Uncharacterized protein n=1 Tax=uncultured Sulfurovum sp. TaxID=269237 RepID=A0A6S6S1T4_9BACT|nr:MAG: Unknown protein [uncultured Sulfurovum sp.]
MEVVKMKQHEKNKGWNEENQPVLEVVKYVQKL